MQSENINELAAALAKAQGQLEHASKDSNNPFFKQKYADLASVWGACRSQLADNGLSIVQLPDGMEDNCLLLVTTMLHSSGQWISSRIKIPLVKVDPQGYGSALTYARRYALAAIVGVYQDDDDGESAQKGRTSASKTNTPLFTPRPGVVEAAKAQEQSAHQKAREESPKLDERAIKVLNDMPTESGVSANDLSLTLLSKGIKDLTVIEGRILYKELLGISIKKDGVKI